VTTNGSLRTKIRVTAREGAKAEQMPAPVRQLHLEIVATADVARSRMPALLESGRQTAGQGSSSSLAMGTARTDATRAWLFLAAVVVALWLLASFELGR
jgi:hypothetical protein